MSINLNETKLLSNLFLRETLTGTNSPCSYTSYNLYVKTKESGSLRGHAPVVLPWIHQWYVWLTKITGKIYPKYNLASQTYSIHFGNQPRGQDLILRIWLAWDIFGLLHWIKQEIGKDKGSYLCPTVLDESKRNTSFLPVWSFHHD